MTPQLREAAERAKEFLGGLTPNSFSQPDSGLTYGQSASVYKELAAAITTYAAEQLAGDGGREDFIALKNATETLILVLGLTAIKHPGQLAVLQEAVDMVKKVLKAHSPAITT